MSTIIGIDYGEKHTGFAKASTPLAEPLCTVDTSKALSFLNDLLQQHHLTKVVIGISEGKMAQKTKAFAAMIESETGLPVVFQDETLSSRTVRTQLAQAGLKRSRLHRQIDHLVAAAILQDYLDSLANRK